MAYLTLCATNAVPVRFLFCPFSNEIKETQSLSNLQKSIISSLSQCLKPQNLSGTFMNANVCLLNVIHLFLFHNYNPVAQVMNWKHKET